MPKKESRETLDPARVVAALNASEGRVYLAAEKLKVSARTVYRYAQRHRAVREAVEHQKGKRLDAAEGKLWDAVKKGEAWAVCFYLKTQGKARGYVERQETRNVGDDEIDREIEAELARLAEGRQTPPAPVPPPAAGGEPVDPPAGSAGPGV